MRPRRWLLVFAGWVHADQIQSSQMRWAVKRTASSVLISVALALAATPMSGQTKPPTPPTQAPLPRLADYG